MYTDKLTIIAGVLLLIPTYWLILPGVFFAGLSTGINSVLIPIYIKEMSPLIISGFTGSMNQASINIGIVMSYLLSIPSYYH